MSLSGYNYDANDAQKAYENKLNDVHPHSSITLSSCAISGLPLGYLPTKKLAYRGTIPFNQLTSHDVYLSVQAAVHSDTRSFERIFAFFALLHKLPPALIEFKSQHLRPNWNESRMRSLLSNRGLRSFAEFVETARTLPPRILALFPAFRVSAGFNESNTNLHEFPSMLARWISLAESSKLAEDELRFKDKQHGYEDRQIVRAALQEKLFFRRQRTEKINVFDPRETPPDEIRHFAFLLAGFYERKPSPEWENFVRDPSQSAPTTIKKVLERVKEINICEADFSDELALSVQFHEWLEINYARAYEQQKASQRMLRMIDNAETYNFQNMNVENVQELLDRKREIEEAAGKPKREQYASMDKYLAALQSWRKQTTLQERAGI